jgi:hypothetical protein
MRHLGNFAQSGTPANTAATPLVLWVLEKSDAHFSARSKQVFGFRFGEKVPIWMTLIVFDKFPQKLWKFDFGMVSTASSTQEKTVTDLGYRLGVVRAFNPLVASSNLARPTKIFIQGKHLSQPDGWLFCF